MPTTRRFRPRFEALEDRRLMAADCGCDQWLDGSADAAVQVAAAEGAAHCRKRRRTKKLPRGG